MALIYCVEDDDGIRELISCALKSGGYEVKAFPKAKPFYEEIRSKEPSLVLLDIMLPELNGYEVCKRLSGSVPVIMLSAKAETSDKVEGLGIGADDYITKPFDTKELLARINAHIRRYRVLDRKTAKPETYKNGELSAVPASQSVYIAGKSVKLTVTEFDLLLFFMQNKNKVLSRHDIAQKLGVTDFDADTRSIDMHIQRLRRKLSGYTEKKLIETVFGLGYIMRDQDETEV